MTSFQRNYGYEPTEKEEQDGKEKGKYANSPNHDLLARIPEEALPSVHSRSADGVLFTPFLVSSQI